jgi:hypothetical protein
MPRSKSSSKTVYVVALLFIAMVLVKSYFTLAFSNPIVIPDEVIYNNIANNIANGRFTTSLANVQDYPPGYPLFLSIAEISADKDLVYHLMLIINCILTSSIIFPAFFILKKFIDEEDALYFSFAASLIPSVVVYTPFILSENLFSPLFLFSAWFLLESISRKDLLFDFLFGFSVFMLFLTRSIAIAMMPGIVLAIILKAKFSKDTKYRSVIKSGATMLVSFILPLFVWYYYKTNNAVPQLSVNELSDASGYNISSYITNINIAFSSIPRLLSFLTLFLHEIDYLILATYFAFFVFAVYSIFKINSFTKKREYLTFALYTLLSSILLVFITTVHMQSSILYGFNSEFSSYDLFGRYLDPVIVPIFIMGIAGFYQFKENNKSGYTHMTRDSYLLIGLCFLSLFTFACTFPYGVLILQANLFAISYIIALNFHPLFVATLCTLLFLAMLILPKNGMFIRTLLILLLLIFLLCDSVLILLPYLNTNDMKDYYPIARYLQTHASSNTLTLFDSNEVSDNQSLLWYPILFWSNSRLMLYPLNDSRACPTIKADYIVSNKTLSYPYKNVTSDGAYSLYTINCS